MERNNVFWKEEEKKVVALQKKWFKNEIAFGKGNKKVSGIRFNIIRLMMLNDWYIYV